MAALVVLLLLVCTSLSAGDIEVQVDESRHLVTEAEYISFTLDAILITNETSPLPWAGLDFHNKRLLTLAQGLAPAHLRWGGTDADRVVFFENEQEYQEYLMQNNHQETDPFKSKSQSVKQMNHRFTRRALHDEPSTPVPMFPRDIDNMLKLSSHSSGKLLFSLNIRPHLPTRHWDPTNSLKLMKYILTKANHGGTNVTDLIGFELGNEWPYFDYDPPAERVGQDFVDLRKALDSIPEYKDAWILGPDGHGIQQIAQSYWEPVITSFTKVAKQISAKALTLHHYYFEGPTSKEEDYRNTDTMDKLGELLRKIKGFMRSAGNDSIPVWIGETADANTHGCFGKTDRFLGTFLWMDKLGLAAENGVSLLARQDIWGFGYAITNSTYHPNPDYWVSYIFKKLAGEKVLFPYMSGSLDDKVRLYARCTATKAGYPAGSVTIFGMNLADSDSPGIRFSPRLVSHMIALYQLTSDGPLTSQAIRLNGKTLQMLDEGIKFPGIKPSIRPVHQALVLPPASLFFAVLPDAHMDICKNTK